METLTATEVEILSPIDAALVKENVTKKVIKELQAYKSLTIKGIDDKEGYEAANKARIACKNVRVLAEKICKSGREEAMQIQKQWIAKEKEVTGQISEVEDYLKGEQSRIDTEKENIRLAAERKDAERIQSRVKALFDNDCTYDGVNYSIGEITINDTQLKVMDDNIFEPFIDRVKVEFDRERQMKEQKEKEAAAELARIEQEKKNEADRIKKDREELEAQQAQFRAQQEQARKEQERIEKEQSEARAALERQANDIRIAKENAERAERERLMEVENQRIAKEKEAIRIEAERLAGIEAENKRIQEQKDREEAERIEAERQASIAPDKEKLLAFSSQLGSVPIPVMIGDATEKIMTDVIGLVVKIQRHIEKAVKTL